MASLADMIGGKVNEPPKLPTSPTLPEPPVNVPELADLTSIEDVASLRGSIFSRVQAAAKARFPVENERYRIELTNLAYKGAKPFSKKTQKEALLQQKSLNWKMHGDWRMVDKESGQMVDERKGALVAHVPYMTERGTFIRNGNEYTVANQSRLRSGAYARRKKNGELETHFNILDGGRSFHLVMDPKTTEFTMRVGGSKMKLAPILRNMGVTPKQLQDMWGTEIMNRNNVDDDSAKRALTQFYRGTELNPKLVDVLGKMHLDPEIAQQTLGTPFENVSSDAILNATRKLIDISKGASKEDDRDALHYQKLMFPDDLISERIEKDWDRRIRGKTLWTSTRKGQLAIQPGHLTPQIDAVFTKSGLASPIEEVNPMEVLDQRYRVVRTGEGGISEAGVPSESRAVQPSHFGMVDPLKTPESLKIGIDSRFTTNIMRGPGGIYAKLRNKEGVIVPVSMKDTANSTVAFPGELRKGTRKVRAMVHGKMQYIDRNKVDYELPNATNMFTVGTNLIPMISGAAGQRVSMGSRFISQALAMKDPEAPLVQAMSDDGINSFEDLYGTKAAAAVRSDVGGRVSKITKDAVFVDTIKGTEKFDLYNNFSYNRKSALNNTATVKIGDHVRPGDLLARSNFTDKKGTLALGKNLRVAFMPWKGLNYEDAFVLSRSAAAKLTSEHMYPVKIDHDTHTQRGIKEYMSLFPTQFNKDQIGRLDDTGVIRPGKTVKKGDPLVLAVRERPQSDIHRGRKPGWGDASEIWDHETDGVVTDVHRAKNGVRIHVKTYKPLQEADKIAVRHGGKGVVARVIPDEQMPHDKDGNHIEVLANPMGVVTRQNPAQLVEAILGKISEKTGKVYKMPAFLPDGESMIDYAINEAKKHGVSDTETLTDPANGREFKDIMTGKQFFMKLHFLAEKKKGARDTGGYTMEDMPARGGPEGCFIATQPIMTNTGEQQIGHIVEKKQGVQVLTFSEKLGEWVYRPVTDWFVYRSSVCNVLSIDFCRGSDGHAVTMHPTKNHGMYKFDGTEITAGELQVGDELIGCGILPTEQQSEDLVQRNRLMKVPLIVKAVRPYVPSKDVDEINVYDITVDDTHRYMASEALVSNSKKLGVWDINALLSHGATEVLKDAKTVRGQKNDDYWRAFQLGHTPPSPEVPMIYKKFLSHMIGSGINIRRTGSQMNLMALRDQDIDKLSRGAIREPKGVNANTMQEIEGGLFDKSLTGGHNGKFWSHLNLNEPMPNPIMEEPIRRLLGLTKKGFESILSGDKEINGRTGGTAIKEALSRIRIPELKRQTEEIINSGVKSRRSDAIKTLGYIKMLEQTGLKPADFVLNKVPVLPPVFRPISATADFVIKTDANSLYVDVMKHNEALKEVKGALGETEAGEERLNLYKSFKSLTGLSDPINPKLKNQGVTGLLKQVFGKGSPKLGMFQYRVLGGTLDQAGMAVVTPNPSLDMDHVGLPENHAWTLYKKFVIRKLVQRGMKPTDAIKSVKNKSASAADVLDEVMSTRPVIMNRAPTLHKFNLLAFYPHLIKGNTLNVSPLVTPGFNMDFDGDTALMHVPVSDSAVEEAKKKMLPSRNLFAIKDFGVHYVPTQEYAYGLFLASSKKKPGAIKAYVDVKSVIAAYKRGEVNVDDRIRVGSGPKK